MSNKVHQLNIKSGGASSTFSQSRVGDGGGGGGNLEAQIAKLESDVEYIKRDVGELKTDVKEIRKDLHATRIWALLLYITLSGALAGLFWDGFNRLSDRSDAVAQEVRSGLKAIEQRLAPPPK